MEGQRSKKVPSLSLIMKEILEAVLTDPSVRGAESGAWSAAETVDGPLSWQ